MKKQHKRPARPQFINPREYSRYKLSPISPLNKVEGRKYVALVQPGSWGDNIISTMMFKPLWAKFPDLQLDVYTSTLYQSAFHNNRYISNLKTYEAHTKDQALHLLKVIPDLIKNAGYDIVYVPHPMINGDKWTSIKSGSLGTSFMCAWVRAMEDTNVDYTLPLETILELTEAEVNRSRSFMNSIRRGNKVNLIEAAGESGQTFIDGKWVIAIAEYLCGKGETVLVSRRDEGPDTLQLKARHGDLFHFVGGYSIRECADIFNYCDRFFSCSSGLSNACNTNWCKKDIEWIEIVNSDAISSAPIRSTGKQFWMRNDLPAFMDMLRSK